MSSKRYLLTPGQELRPVSDLHQVSALHSDHSSLKPEGFVTAQLLIFSHQKASACQLREGKKRYLHSRTLPLCKKILAFHLPAKQSSLLFAWLERLHLLHPPSLQLRITCRHRVFFFSLFQLLLFCKGPGAHSWEERAALITPKGDTPTHWNSQERGKKRAAMKAVSPLVLVSESKDKLQQ